MGAARSKRPAARFHHRHPEKPARRLRPHRFRSSLEKETCRRFRSGRNSYTDHPQTHRPSRSFRRRHRLSDSLPALPSGYCRAPRRTRPPARKGKFPDHTKPETLSHPLSHAGKTFLIWSLCALGTKATVLGSLAKQKERTVPYPVTVRSKIRRLPQLARLNPFFFRLVLQILDT